jgi:mRNA-degrading endonuclease toxin of MazEF toxin-antitoxin module
VDFDPLLGGMANPRKAMADQIATVGKQRLKSKLATLSLDDVRAIERAIRVQLGLTTS